MVGTAQPICLLASGTERRRHDRIMNLWSWIDHRVSLQYEGWTARPFFWCLTAAGEAFVLTSPFIERDYRNVARARSFATPNTRLQLRESAELGEPRFYVPSPTDQLIVFFY